MSRRARTTESLLDAFLEIASREQLIRLQTDVNAVLRWKYQHVSRGPGYDDVPPAPTKVKGVRKPKAQLELSPADVLAVKEGA